MGGEISTFPQFLYKSPTALHHKCHPYLSQMCKCDDLDKQFEMKYYNSIVGVFVSSICGVCLSKLLKNKVSFLIKLENGSVADQLGI